MILADYIRLLPSLKLCRFSSNSRTFFPQMVEQIRYKQRNPKKFISCFFPIPAGFRVSFSRGTRKRRRGARGRGLR